MTITKTIKIDVEADQATKDLEKFNDTVEETDESTEGLTNQLDAMTGGAVAGFGKIMTSLKGVVRGFKSVKVAIAATGLGLLVIAIGSVVTAFKASEEGQNKFAKIMKQIGVVTGNVIDILANLGESLLAAGKALVKLAKGDIKAASAAWGEFKENIKETTEGIKNFGKETRAELKSAIELSNALARADIIDRELLEERAQATRDIAELRLKSEQKDKFAVQERIKFLTEANAIEEEITNKAIESARIRAEAKTLENSLSKSTKEDLEEEAQLKANIIDLETQRLNLNKRLATRLIEFRNEEIAALKQIEDLRIKQIEDETAAAEAGINAELERDQKLADEKFAQQLTNEARSRAEKEKQAALDEELEKTKFAVGLQLAGQTSALVAQIVKKDSKAAKGVAVVQATISGIESTLNAFKTANSSPITAYFPAYPFIQAGIAGAFSLAQIAKIKSTDPSKGSGGGGVSTGGSGGGGRAPSFNLVRGTGTNQITEGLTKDQAPIKSYVVSSDVSTGQELDRKIIEGASL